MRIGNSIKEKTKKHQNANPSILIPEWFPQKTSVMNFTACEAYLREYKLWTVRVSRRELCGKQQQNKTQKRLFCSLPTYCLFH